MGNGSKAVVVNMVIKQHLLVDTTHTLAELTGWDRCSWRMKFKKKMNVIFCQVVKIPKKCTFTTETFPQKSFIYFRLSPLLIICCATLKQV